MDLKANQKLTHFINGMKEPWRSLAIGGNLSRNFGMKTGCFLHKKKFARKIFRAKVKFEVE